MLARTEVAARHASARWERDAREGGPLVLMAGARRFLA